MLAQSLRPHVSSRRYSHIERLIVRQGTPTIEGVLLGAATVAADAPASTVVESHTNEALRLSFADGTRGWFKPIDGIASKAAWAYGQSPGSSVAAERLAWEVAFFLGPPYDRLVAPVVLREVDIGGESRFGVVSAHCPGDTRVSLNEISLHSPEDIAAAGFFDALIANQDRHSRNYLWHEATAQLALIDHGLSFPEATGMRRAQVFIEWRHDSDRSVTSTEREALERILDSEFMAPDLLLDKHRATQLAFRAQRMIETGRVIGPETPLRRWIKLCLRAAKAGRL